MKRSALVATLTIVACAVGAGYAEATTIEIRAEASHGYRLHIKASDQNNKRARVELKKNGAFAYYSRKRDVHISKRRLRFDLGPRGNVDLRFRKRTTNRCDGKVRARRGIFRGELRFDGEHGYASIDRSRVPGLVVIRGRCHSGGLPFPLRPNASRAADDDHFLLACGPEPMTSLYAESFDHSLLGAAGAVEKHPWARVARIAIMPDEMTRFRVFKHGKRATLRSSGGRFEGVAHYARGRTSGNLTVDLPGRLGLPLVPGDAILDDWNSPGPRCSN